MAVCLTETLVYASWLNNPPGLVYFIAVVMTLVVCYYSQIFVVNDYLQCHALDTLRGALAV